MTKKDRKAISNGSAVIFLLTGLFLYWMVLVEIIYIFLGIILAKPFVKAIIYSILQGNKTKKSSTGKKQVKNKGNTESSPNQLREDLIIYN